MEEQLKKSEKNKVSKNEFNVFVTYEKNGKSFQDVIESILLRKLSEN